MQSLYPVIMAVPKTFSGLPRAEKQRTLSRLARKPLSVSARKAGLPLPAALEKDRQGAPLPVDGRWWSISHKPDFVGGIVCLQRAGIDIEIIAPSSPALLNKIAKDEEQGLFDDDSLTTLFRCWTAKEAVLKAEGKGLAGLARCRIDKVLTPTRLTVIFNENTWFVEHWYFNNHLAAVAKRKSDVVKWTLLDEYGDEITNGGSQTATGSD